MTGGAMATDGPRRPGKVPVTRVWLAPRVRSSLRLHARAQHGAGVALKRGGFEMSPETEGAVLSTLERYRTEYYNEADAERLNPARAERLRSRGDALAAVIADIVAKGCDAGRGSGNSGGGAELRGTVTNDPCAAVSEPPIGTVRAPYGEIRDVLDNNGRLPFERDGGPRYWSGTAGDSDGFSEWRITRRSGRSDEWIVCAGTHAVAWLRRELGKAGLTID